MARVVVDLPNEPTTAMTRVLRTRVCRYSRASRDSNGQLR